MDTASTPGVGGTLTAGIQDISALLPLLGTEQCEEHVGSALSDGYLYAAAAPMSIFGSLGVARAGFKAIVASISIPHWRFHGAVRLQDAGFHPSGKNLALIMMDPEHPGRYLAETRIDVVLKGLQEELHIAGLSQLIHINDFRRLTITTAYPAWNVRMTLFAATLCFLGFAPYVHLIVDRGGSPREHITRWVFPITRVLGGFLTAISLQFLVQWRLLRILKKRLVFHALNSGENASFLGSHHPSLLWDPQFSSEACLPTLGQVVRRRDKRRGWIARRTPAFIWKFLETQKRHSRRTIQDATATPDHTDDKHRQSPEITSRDLEAGLHDQGDETLDRLAEELDEANRHMFPVFEIWGPMLHVLMVLGIIASVVGYVGCFSVVQGASRSLGPVIWLLLEASLSVLRMVLWGWNPKFDDPDPVRISLQLSSRPPLATCDKSTSEIFEEQILPVVPAPDFIRSIKSYTGFMEHFDESDTSVFYTLARTSSEAPAKTGQPALFITVVDRIERTTRVYYEDAQKARRLFDACRPVVTDTYNVLHTRFIRELKPDLLVDTRGRLSSLRRHYQSILEQLRIGERGSATFVDEICVDWNLGNVADSVRGFTRRKVGRKSGKQIRETGGKVEYGDIKGKRL